MTQKEMAKGLLDQARSSLESAKRASEDGNWAYAVRTSQDASELSVKALLLTTGDEPPKVHDLAGALKQHRDKLGQLGLGKHEVDEMAKTASSLAEDRSKALYGDEKRDIPANKIYEKKDAVETYRAAERVCDRCREVVEKKL